MDPRIQRVHEARTRAELEIRSILDAAGDEIGAEDQATIDRLDTESRDLNATLTQLLEDEQRRNDVDASLATLGTPESRDADEGPNVELELRELANGERRTVAIAPERRDLTAGTATDGQELVPQTMYSTLVEHMVETSGVLSAGATVINTSGGEPLEIPVTTSYSASVIEGEGDAIAESDPQFATRTLGAFKYAHLVQVSRELIDDEAFGLTGFLARQSGRSVGLKLGSDLAVGGGSGAPRGITLDSTLGKTSATSVSGAFTADDLIDLFYSVISPYRNSPNAGWLMRDASIASLRKLEDGNGNRLFQPSMALGTPDTLLGKPIHTDPNIVAQATDAKSVVFGDISAYYVRIAGGVRFERSDDFAFNTDLVTFKCVLRADGILADQTGAVKHFVGAAS